MVVALGLRASRPPTSRGPVVPAATAAASLSVARATAALPDAAVPAAGPRALHGDERRTHRVDVVGPKAARVAWRTSVGGPVVAQVTASPDGRTLHAVTLGGELVALDRASGDVRFRVNLGGRAYGAPLVLADGTLVVGSDAKALLAISKSGAIRTRLELGEEVDTSPVLTARGDIVVAAGPTLVAVKPSLDVAWRYRARGKIFTSPAVTPAGIVVIGSQDDHVHAVSPTGDRVWSVDLGADVDGAPAVDDDGSIVVGTDGGEVVRLDGEGHVLARTAVGGFVRGPLSIARNGDVVTGTYGPSPRLVRVSRAGGVVFELAVPGTGAREHGVHGGALEDAAGVLFFGAQDDRVRAIAPGGTVAFTFETGGDVDAPLSLLDGGGLVVPSEDGWVTMLLP